MSVAVVIAWRDCGDPVRARRLDFVAKWWQHEFPDVELVLGDSDHETFSSYRASNAGARSTDADVLVFTDADVIPNRSAVASAILLAELPGLVWAFTRAYYLTETATERYLAGERADWTGEDCELICDGSSGGTIALSRATFDATGGYDERFRGWGFGDVAFAVTGDLLVAPWRRVDGDLIHLWHPRDPHSFTDSPLYAESSALWHRYRAAMDEGPNAVRAVRQESLS